MPDKRGGLGHFHCGSVTSQSGSYDFNLWYDLHLVVWSLPTHDRAGLCHRQNPAQATAVVTVEV